MFEPRVKAVLGPTNTGKTHLAITRMLAHSSGIIGFPLRLLARENYDRMVAAKGEQHVALITGEEKIIPPEARWFACTVEAMPLDRKVEFLAVDEIQLCADPDRGHVFTDRLLHARGMVETMFLGAETIRPLLQRLVPRAEIETRPRLSQLTYAGPAKLTRLPPRSAVVAFSAGEVYAIAEAIRRRRGGCAVVMGRLSPRTRNAQVALYQEREVDFLVATDAIGMGLNMDVDHVAFASLTKFDGHRSRELSAQEAAQIAGRAGRGMRDGTFGVTADCPPLSDEIVEKIESHQFEPLQTLAWRNSALDFASPEALLESLAAPPPFAGLAKGNDADDHITLAALARMEDVRGLANSRSRVALLWEACQIPDFRKLADETHQNFCARAFKHLAQDGHLPEDWIASGIASCNSIEGDLDTLMARLASIRVWSFVAARNDWFRDAARFQGEAREAEDRVSDALHERLTARFVDRRAAHLMRKLDDGEEELLSAVTRRGEVVVEGHPVGKISGFNFEAATEAGAGEEERKALLRAARRALKEEMPRRVSLLEASNDDAFGLTPLQRVTWTLPGSPPPGSPGHEAAEIARLKAGPSADKPLVEPLNSEFLDSAQRERVRARLATWLENTIKKAMAPLEAAETKAAEDSSLRGHLFRLREYLGLVPGGTEREITPELRAKLKGIGVRAGRFALYLPEMLKPRPMALRAQLWALAAESAVPPLPVGGLVSITPPSNWPAGFAAQMGWVLAGEVMIRLDVAERVAGELGHLTRRAPALLPGDIASRLGVKAEALAPALTALGFRLLNAEPLPDEMFGPPAPLMVAARREDHHRHGRHDHRGRGQPGAGQGGRGRERGGQGSGQGEGRGANRPAPATAAEGENPAAAEVQGAEGQGAEGQGGQPASGTPDGAPRPRDERPREGNRHGRRDERHGKGPGQGGDKERGERSGGDRPRGDRPQGDRPQGNRQGGDRPRGDRPRGDRPFSDRDRRGGDREPRVFQIGGKRDSGPDPDSPFAALAKLKLGK
ncbi:helicase-related protein [Roseomonas gilardii]|uniref:Helicase-related protein n=1 Tax=Roseomonas gilardii TaxID=257708 RepID=A0ABU3M9B7_9PROT|nr:helicase-related protein [Roseomonas gilardii]MDT8329513.1 helicase-related protein [Roseomonas gilardii]